MTLCELTEKLNAKLTVSYGRIFEVKMANKSSEKLVYVKERAMDCRAIGDSPEEAFHKIQKLIAGNTLWSFGSEGGHMVSFRVPSRVDISASLLA